LYKEALQVAAVISSQLAAQAAHHDGMPSGAFLSAILRSSFGCLQAARVGAIAAPFMLMLGSQLRIGSPVFLPYLIFGAISCLAGLLVLLLPVSACWKHCGSYCCTALMHVMQLPRFSFITAHHTTPCRRHLLIVVICVIPECWCVVCHIFLQETLGAAMPESMTDLQQLQSIFSAQPWRQGCMGILSFIFRTRAHAATAVRGKPTASLPRSGAGNKANAVVVTAVCGELEAHSDHSIAGRCDSRSKPRAKPASTGTENIDIHVSCTAEEAKPTKPGT
jgi:hypothetical protein